MNTFIALQIAAAVFCIALILVCFAAVVAEAFALVEEWYGHD